MGEIGELVMIIPLYIMYTQAFLSGSEMDFTRYLSNNDDPELNLEFVYSVHDALRNSVCYLS